MDQLHLVVGGIRIQQRRFVADDEGVGLRAVQQAERNAGKRRVE